MPLLQSDLTFKFRLTAKGVISGAVYPFIYIFLFGGGGSSGPDSDRLPSNRSRDFSATVGAASISPGSHYTETARKRGSETEMKIEEKRRGKGKIGQNKDRQEHSSMEVERREMLVTLVRN